MALKLFITATNTGIGKTFCATKILETLGQKRVKIGAVKPIETGVTNIPQDATKLLQICKKYNSNFKNFTPNDICAYTFSLPAAPYSADNKKVIKIEQIVNKISQIEKLCDFLIIEGAGGLYVPIKKNYFMIDLIKEIDAKALLVTPSYLGCINETLLSIKALESKKIEFEWCVNLYKDEEFNLTTKSFYDSYFKSWQSLEEYLEGLKVG